MRKTVYRYPVSSLVQYSGRVCSHDWAHSFDILAVWQYSGRGCSFVLGLIRLIFWQYSGRRELLRGRRCGKAAVSSIACNKDDNVKKPMSFKTLILSV